MLFSLLPYSIGVVFAIIVPAIIIALQEQQIEGPFGWSSMTFTKRWPVNSLFSKIYRGVTGEDKWATGYHLMSNTIWVLIFSVSLLYVPLFSMFAEINDTYAFLNTIAIAVFSCIQLMWVEDFIWFLINPYYGPERHTPEYVPWFQYFKGKIPSTYWVSMIAGLLVTVVMSLITGETKMLIVWGESMILLIVTVFLVIKPLSGKIKRYPLKKFWWKDNKYIITVRCPYAIEREEPFTKARALVIDKNTLKELISENKAIELGRSLKE
jgi:hypothetical protein